MKNVACVLFATLVVTTAVPRAAPAPPVMNPPQVQGSTVTLSWTVPFGATGIRLEAGTAPGFSNAANSVIGAIGGYTAENVPPGTYHVRVRAIDATGESAPSNEVIVTVGASSQPPPAQCAAPPTQPTLLAPVIDGNEVSLQWTPPTAGCPATAYTLLAGSTPGASNIAVVNAGPALSFRATAPNGVYYLRVVATNAGGTSAPSNETTLIIGPAPPTTTPVAETYTGAISTSDATCTVTLGTLPCRIIAFTPAASGNLDALLSWPSPQADLDLYLYDGTARIAASVAATGTQERIVAPVLAGRIYQLRVVLYRNAVGPQNYTLSLVRPAGSTNSPPPPPPQSWSNSGCGNTVFDMPRSVSRVRVTGTWNGLGGSTFFVDVDGRGLVTEVLRDQPNRRYEGIHLTTGGVVAITSSTNICWTFTQVQ